MIGELTINSLADYKGEMVQIKDIGVKKAVVISLETSGEIIAELEDLNPVQIAPQIGVAITNLIHSVSMTTVEKIDSVGDKDEDGNIVISRNQLMEIARGNLFLGSRPFSLRPEVNR